MRKLLLAVLISTAAAYAQNVGGSIGQATTGGGGVSSVTGTAPVTSSGGLTPAIACTTCSTNAATLASGQILVGAGGQAIQTGNLSGDISTSGSGVTTLATVNAGPGACGDATHVCAVTTNGKGLVTNQAATTIGNATTATALAAAPTVCTGQFDTGIAANGNATCSATLTTPLFNSQFSTDSTPAIIWGQKARGVSGTPTTVVNADTLIKLEAQGYTGAGYTSFGQMFFNAQNASSSLPGGEWFLRTSSNVTGTMVQAVVVDQLQDGAFAHNLSVGRGSQLGSTSVGLDVYGQQITTILGTPATPVITQGGTAGATNYSYVIVPKYFDGTHGPGSVAGTTAAGNATLSVTNFNTATWTATSNAYCYDVYQTVPANHQLSLCQTTLTYNDVGTTINNNAPPATNNTGTIQVGGYLKSGVSTNTDLAGQVTLVAGSGSYTFTGAYTSAPICTATDSTAAAAVKASTTTTTLTLTGTTTDVLNYICVGRN